MSSNEKTVFWLTVILSLALSLVAVTIALPRTEGEISFDYQGVFVAIFAALITLLIGWQIFNAIGLNRQVDQAIQQVEAAIARIEYLDKELQEKAEKLADLNYSMYFVNCATQCYQQGRKSDGTYNLKDIVVSYRLLLQGLKHLLKTDIKTDETAYTLTFSLEFLEIQLNIIERETKGDKTKLQKVISPDRLKAADSDLKYITSKISILNAERQQELLNIYQRHHQLIT